MTATASIPRARPQPAQLPRVQVSAGAGAVLGLLLAHGAVVVEGALDPSAFAQLEGELRPWFDAALHGRGLLFGRRTRRFSGLFAKSAACADLAIHPLLVRCAPPPRDVGEAGSLWYNIRTPARVGLPAPITTLLSQLAADSRFEGQPAPGD